MNEPNDVHRRLEAWGNDEPPLVDGAFANRLDSDLRSMHHGARRPGLADAPRPIWQPAALALAALFLVVGGVVAFTRTSTDDITLVMAAATETEVVLPDGETVAGSVGLELPDGTQISVGADGSAVIAGVVLEAGTQAVTIDGQLEILVDAGPEPTVPDDPDPTSSTTTPPSTRPTTSTTDGTTSTTTRRSTTTASTTTPPTTGPPPTTVPTTGPPTSVDRPSTTASAPAVVLDWGERDGRVRLVWTYAGPDAGPDAVAGWRVTVASGDRSQTLAVLRDPAARAITVERLAVAATYRVIAVDAGGGVVAESNTVLVPG